MKRKAQSGWRTTNRGNRVARRVAPLGFLARELLGEIPSLIAGR